MGGGPDVESNAAQIEGHVRFVTGLLPGSSHRAVLFADGKSTEPSVSYADASEEADAERALNVLLADQEASEPVLTRAPKLDVPADGAARWPEFQRALGKVSAQAAKASTPLLLYFAGHGSRDDKDEGNEADTRYDLWNGEELPVHVLADELARLPRQVLVMAQCFSGAFANVLFAHGDPKGKPVERDVAGFFSARKDREASGCSFATGRADYQDFSSYFFGALSGRDRFGGKVEGADYDQDVQQRQFTTETFQFTMSSALCVGTKHARPSHGRT